MYIELFVIPYRWGGVPIFGFGVLLALWALLGVGGLAVSVRRHGWTAEVWSLLPLLALFAAAILGLPKIFPDGLPIRGYGVLVLCGAVAGVAMAQYRARQAGLDHELILSLALWMVIGGVVGARLFYVIEYWDQRIRADTVLQTIGRILHYPQGGLVIYGGLFGAALATILLLRKERIPLLPMADLIAPSLVVGLALGRVGCLLAGCCYGGPTSLPWAVTFPPESPPYQDQAARGEVHGFSLGRDAAGQPVVQWLDADSAAAAAGLSVGDVIVQWSSSPEASSLTIEQKMHESMVTQSPLVLKLATGAQITLPPSTPPARSQPVHPTQIYSAINAGLLAGLLWILYPRRRRDGEIFALLLTIYPVSRFVLEAIRIDEPAVFGTGLSISQNISIAIFVAVIGFWYYLSRQPRGVLWPVGKSS